MEDLNNVVLSGLVTDNRILIKNLSDAVKVELATSGLVSTTDIQDAAIIESKLGLGAVITSKLGPASVTDTKLASEAVLNVNIVSGAVTGEKIDQSTINNINLAPSSVDSENIIKTDLVLTSSEDGTTIPIEVPHNLNSIPSRIITTFETSQIFGIGPIVGERMGQDLTSYL